MGVQSVSDKNVLHGVLPAAPQLRRNHTAPIVCSSPLIENEEKIKGKDAKKGFMGRLKMNNRRRRKSGVFSKLFDRFSNSKKRREDKKRKALIIQEDVTDEMIEDSVMCMVDDDNSQKNEELSQEFDLQLADLDQMEFDVDCKNNDT